MQKRLFPETEINVYENIITFCGNLCKHFFHVDDSSFCINCGLQHATSEQIYTYKLDKGRLCLYCKHKPTSQQANSLVLIFWYANLKSCVTRFLCILCSEFEYNFFANCCLRFFQLIKFNKIINKTKKLILYCLGTSIFILKG